MAVDRFSPQIAMLQKKIEALWGKVPRVHNDFLELAEAIKTTLHRHISETTLERVWGYSCRGYKTVSLHTLDMLSEFAGAGCWQNFCQSLREEGIKDSDMFDDFSIFSEELEAGDRVLIKWLPDRECVVRYLGNNKFVAETCKNSSMQTGDTFSCLEFRLNQPAVMEQFISIDDASKNPKRYVAGLKHGISHLQKLNT